MSLHVPAGAACADLKRSPFHGCLWLACGATLLASAACGAAPQPDPAFGVITIGGATYRMPAEAFDGGQAYQGPQSSMLLNLPPPPGMNDPDGEPLQVLLVAPAASNPAERERQVQASLMSAADAATSLTLAQQGKPLTPAGPHAADAPEGMVQVVADPSNIMSSDVFARRPLAHVSDYIACSKAGSDIAQPLCSQGFGGPGVVVKVSYPRKAMSQWLRIKQSVLAYLQDHRGS